jgi:DNA-binding CsgD family transcriptional regulator
MLDAGEPEAIQLAERSLAQASGGAGYLSIDDALWACGYCYTFAGYVGQARDALTRLRASVAGRDDVLEELCRWLLALVELRAGNWSLAREHAERSQELSQMFVGVEQEEDAEAGIPLALVCAYQGDEVVARRIAERGVSLAESSGHPFFASWHHGVLGMLDHWAGESAAAVDHLAAGMSARENLGFREPAAPFYRVDYVEALLRLGRVDEALGVLDPWHAVAERLARQWPLAETAHCRGMVAAARGDVEAAQQILQRAVGLHSAAGHPFGRFRALLALGVVRRRAHHKRAAREAICGALEGFEALGARRWVEQARAELGRIGGRSPEAGLTRAEMRVAELVAQGRTNREVAAALFLSERTVESHLTHAYAKLGVRSRTELARALQ